MTNKIDFRSKAKSDLARSKELLADGELRGSALYARMTIESLAYEILQQYEDEVFEEQVQTWQPGRLLKELVAIDASADKTKTIRIGREEDGFLYEGEETRISASKLNRLWQRAGSFLHIPTIGQVRDGKDFNGAKAEKAIRAIHQEVDEVLASTVFNFILNVHNSKECSVCGFMMKRRYELLYRDKKTTCSNCKSVFQVYFEGDKVGYSLAIATLTCSSCGEKSQSPAREYVEGSEIKCDHCGAVYVFENKLVPSLKTEEVTIPPYPFPDKL